MRAIRYQTLHVRNTYAAKEKGISLTLSDKLGDFDGGVILSENGVDKNFTFEIEVALLKEQTEANVAKEIFG